MASTNQEAVNQQQLHRKRGPNMMLLLPLIYAPVLPLIRITLKHKPVLRDRLFFGVLAGAFIHGTYLVYPFSVSLFCFVFGKFLLFERYSVILLI
ncbi:hypothetical protein RND81_08G060900 [Saponaria officinalis]|uniref:Uncharacterized protein n=1 Tax=Saponaria officinalis TaxID=3572 RepID=A0AAW1J3V9_SAPOF